MGQKLDDWSQDASEQRVFHKLLQEKRLSIILNAMLRAQKISSSHHVKSGYLLDYQLKNYLRNEGIDFEVPLYAEWRSQKLAEWQRNTTSTEDKLAGLQAELENIRYHFTTDYDDQMRIDYQERYEQIALYSYNLLSELTGLTPVRTFKDIPQKLGPCT